MCVNVLINTIDRGSNQFKVAFPKWSKNLKFTCQLMSFYAFVYKIITDENM